jgi:phospholipase D
MSSTVIANALIKAKQKGLVVEIILDKSNLSQNYSQINELKDNGIVVAIDRVPGIAHNKVMIIDKTKVITGSFNFTAAAETRNAENVIIVNDKEIANKYLENWYSRKNKTVNIK